MACDRSVLRMVTGHALLIINIGASRDELREGVKYCGACVRHCSPYPAGTVTLSTLCDVTSGRARYSAARHCCSTAGTPPNVSTSRLNDNHGKSN